MVVDVIRSLSDLRKVKERWTSLWQAHPRAEIFQHPGWSLAVTEAYEWEDRLYVLAVKDESGIILGLCPWSLADGKISWLTSPRADYNDVVCSVEDGPRVVKACLDHLRQTSGKVWREVLLEDVADDSVWSTNLGSLSAGGLVIEAENARECWNLKLDKQGKTLNEILTKKGYDRNVKALTKIGALSLHEWCTQEQRLAALPPFFDLHADRWQALGQTSLFADKSSRDFYTLLVLNPDLEKMIDFTSLKAGTETLAHHFGFWGDGRYLAYKWCFDRTRSKAGPGTVLMVHLMVRAAGNQFFEFDFMRGGEIYKSRFANANHLLHDWRAFSSPVSRQLHRLKGQMRERYPELARCLGAVSRGDVRGAWEILQAASAAHGSALPKQGGSEDN